MIQLQFNHGLGDCVHFACAMKVWVDKGHDIRVIALDDRQLVFRAAGCKEPEPIHKFGQFLGNAVQGYGGCDLFNFPHPGYTKEYPMEPFHNHKLAFNLLDPKLPHIGQIWDIWGDVCKTKLSLDQFITDQQREKLEKFRSRLGKYLVWHTRGDTYKSRKNLPLILESQFPAEFLKHVDTVLVLDRHGEMNHYRTDKVATLQGDYGATSLPELWYLSSKASMMVGVDSGPYHLMRFTDVPALCCWFHLDPGSFSLPRPLNLNLTPNVFIDRDNVKRNAYNIRKTEITAGLIGELVGEMIAGKAPSSLLG